MHKIGKHVCPLISKKWAVGAGDLPMIEGGLPVESDVGLIPSLGHAYLQTSVFQRAVRVEIASRVSVSLGTQYGSLGNKSVSPCLKRFWCVRLLFSPFGDVADDRCCWGGMAGR